MIRGLTVEQNCVVFRTAGDLVGPTVTIAVNGIVEAYNSNLKTTKAIIIDFSGKFTCDDKLIKDLGPFMRVLKANNIRIYAANPTDKVAKLILGLGMDNAIHCTDSLTAAFNEVNPKGQGINVEFVNPFIDGTMETLKVQCSTECKPGKLYIKDTQPQQPVDIAGILGITSPGFRGSLAICFPKQVFLGLMNRMLGENYQEITAELQDGAGELLNIIFGFAKRVLNQNGYQLEKAIPTVLRGSELQVKHLGPGPSIVLPFGTDLGEFYIEVCSEP